MFVNVDWFFISHRLPIANAARQYNFDMSVFADLTMQDIDNSSYQFDLNKSPLERQKKISPKIFLEFLRAFCLIKRREPDLIHAVTIKPIIFLGIISRITSTPFIAAFSGLGPVFKEDKYYQRIILKLIVLLLKFIFKNNNSIAICQTDHDQKELIRHGIIKSQKISLIPGSGVDTNMFSPSKKREDLGRFILMSSRILLDKGVNEYCSAAKIVNANLNEKINFFLTGPIDLSSPTSITQTELDIITSQNGVKYLGNRNDMPELLASAEIFVLPTYYPEGIPKVLIEASSCCTPIITTNHPGCRDIIINEESGILVPTKDSNELASAILRLLKNKKAQLEYGRRGRKQVKDFFEESKIIKAHFKIYEKLSSIKSSV